MTEKVEVARRLRLGQGIRQIHRETGVHRTIIREIKAVAELSGWIGEKVPLPSEAELGRVLRGESAMTVVEGAPDPSLCHPLDRFKADIERWRAEGKSIVVIHQLVSEQYGCSEPTVRRYIPTAYSPSRHTR
jgi:hypothetical protein